MCTGMNLLSRLSPTYRRSLAESSACAGREDVRDRNPRMLPYSEMMSTLRELKVKDFNLYHVVKQEALSHLQAAVRTADDALDIRALASRSRSVPAGLSPRRG